MASRRRLAAVSCRRLSTSSLQCHLPNGPSHPSGGRSLWLRASTQQCSERPQWRRDHPIGPPPTGHRARASSHRATGGHQIQLPPKPRSWPPSTGHSALRSLIGTFPDHGRRSIASPLSTHGLPFITTSAVHSARSSATACPRCPVSSLGCACDIDLLSAQHRIRVRITASAPPVADRDTTHCAVTLSPSRTASHHMRR